MSGAHSQSPRFATLTTSTLARLPVLASKTVRALAFWLAVVFPVAYLPLLSGGVGPGELLPFIAVLAGNVLALTVGHDYAR
ncbi:hypothetical protein [Salinigranum halophilum]|jgi:hypothetical protein|uniref:hypothetical protein n=1 Tax=Salinigranum halophilum TaxID=2565931 RepID=UPI00115CEBAD|nr:hypothetical protein [Salinigranum halophilum]